MVFFNLGMPASAAATHRHEFSSTQHSSQNPPQEPAMAPPEHSFFHPLQFIHAQLQAFTSSSSNCTPQPSTPAGDSEQQSELDETPDNDSQEQVAQDSSKIERKRIPVLKSTTSYQLAHPPPSAKNHHRLHIRRRTILQLRKITGKKCAAPSLEVFASHSFARPIARRKTRSSSLQRAIPVNGLVVLNCESYKNNSVDKSEESSDDEDIEQRAIVASIQLIPKPENPEQSLAEICIGEDVWTGSKTQSGRYEFVCFDENGERARARWIPNTTRLRQSPLAQTPSPATPDTENRKFKFSLLVPDQKKHPFIATMDRQTISISDQYIIPETPSSEPFTPSTPTSPSQADYFRRPSNKTSPDNIPERNAIINTSENTQLLILITGIFLSICEGYSDSVKVALNAPPSSAWKFRSASSRTDSGLQEPVVLNGNRTPTPQSFGSSTRSRTFNVFHHRQAPSATYTPLQTPQTPNFPNTTPPMPQRSNSAAAALAGAISSHSSPSRSVEDLTKNEVPTPTGTTASTRRRRRGQSTSAINYPPTIAERVPTFSATAIATAAATSNLTQSPVTDKPAITLPNGYDSPRLSLTDQSRNSEASRDSGPGQKDSTGKRRKRESLGRFLGLKKYR